MLSANDNGNSTSNSRPCLKVLGGSKLLNISLPSCFIIPSDTYWSRFSSWYEFTYLFSSLFLHEPFYFFAHGQGPATPGGDLVHVQTAPCLLPSWHRDCCFYDGLFLFFSRKVLLKFYLHEMIHFHLFVPPNPPLSGSLGNAKKLKVPHADADSSLDVLGVWPWVHECAYHWRNCSSISAGAEYSCLLYTCPLPPWKDRECVWETEKGREEEKVTGKDREREDRREQERNL